MATALHRGIDMPALSIFTGDVRTVLRDLPDNRFDCIVTSPPYWGLRNYGDTPGQIGLEGTPEEYVFIMGNIFEELLRVLSPQGTCWLNIGDTMWGGKGTSGAGWDNENNLFAQRKGRTGVGSYGTTRPQDRKHPEIRRKGLVGIPWMLAFELRRRGWSIRQEIIWEKPNCQPEQIRDRCTRSHETIFFLVKQESYNWNTEEAQEPTTGTSKDRGHGNYRKASLSAGSGSKGNTSWSTATTKVVSTRNTRTVWRIPTEKNPFGHFAAFPRELAARCIRLGCPPHGHVLDPFAGTGTTLQVARELGRIATGIEINPAYVEMINQRMSQPVLISSI